MKPQCMRYLKIEKLWLTQAQRPESHLWASSISNLTFEAPPQNPQAPGVICGTYIYTCGSLTVDQPLLLQCPLIPYLCCPGSYLSLAGVHSAIWRSSPLPLLPWKYQCPQWGYCLRLLSKLPNRMPEQCWVPNTDGLKGLFSHALT